MLKRPQSMEELVYYTSRTIGDGEVTVWVLKQLCPKCGKSLMGKPKGEKGKVKVRAKECVCPDCGYAVEKKEYEEGLMACVDYICPECKKRSAYRAMICSQCDTIYIPIQNNNDYRDRCPDCGYSKAEERKNAAK